MGMNNEYLKDNYLNNVLEVYFDEVEYIDEGLKELQKKNKEKQKEKIKKQK